MNGIKENVRFTGEQGSLMDRAKRAFDRIAVYPEVIKKLAASKQLHDRPLEVHVTSTEDNGYFAPYNRIYCNPTLTDTQTLNDANGNPFPLSLERYFAHEIEHSTQPMMDGETAEYKERVSEIRTEVLHEQIRENQLKRKNATAAAPTESELEERRIKWHLIGVSRERQDSIVQDYIRKFEGPCIAFENMLAPLLGEPLRGTDYYDSSLSCAAKEYIKKSAIERRSGRDPQVVRPDASPKSESMQRS